MLQPLAVGRVAGAPQPLAWGASPQVPLRRAPSQPNGGQNQEAGRPSQRLMEHPIWAEEKQAR